MKQLLALTNGRTDGGLDDLKTFNTDTSESAYQELISKTWKLVNCVEEYHHKLWLKMSKKILHNNKIIMHMFRAAQDASVNLRTWVLMHKVLGQLLPPLAFNTGHMLHR